MTRTVKIYEVLTDLDNEFGGPADDGMETYRFRSIADATDWAKSHTCWGRPAQVSQCDAPIKLARRWGVA